MLGIFKGRSSNVRVIDKFWLTQEAKWKACCGLWAADTSCVFVAWFEATKQLLDERLGISPEKSPVVMADDVLPSRLAGRVFMFVEHYPLAEKEDTLYDRLSLCEVPVLSALDEPLFQYVGGERLAEVIQKLGMADGEVIDHSFVTSAVRGAQRKLALKVKRPQPANSQKEWFEKNL